MKRDIKIIDGKYFILSENYSTCSGKCKRWNYIEESEFHRLKELGHKDVTEKPKDVLDRTVSPLTAVINDLDESLNHDNIKSTRIIKDGMVLDTDKKEDLDILMSLDPDYFKKKEDKGSRFNEGKLRWSLVDLKYLEGLVQVLMYGSEKYSDYNWQKGLPTLEVYESLMRHIIAWKSGENKDLESGLDHIDHAICNLYFIKWMIANKPSFDTRRTIVPEQEFTEPKYPSENEK